MMPVTLMLAFISEHTTPGVRPLSGEHQCELNTQRQLYINYQLDALIIIYS